MFGIRTPSKKAKTERAGPLVVRRSIGEIEARMTTPTNKPTTTQSAAVEQKTKLSQHTSESKPTYKNRTSEAKACLVKAKLQLANSRNLRSDIKENVLNAIERLYQLVKEAEGKKDKGTKQGTVVPEEERRKERSKEQQLRFIGLKMVVDRIEV